MEDIKTSRDGDFHLYLLIGQSNMAGRGVVEAEDQQVHPRVFKLNKACDWEPAVDPLHFDKPSAGVGPGLTFGRMMADLRPTIRVGLIPCALSGTPITVWKQGFFWDVMNCAPYDDALRRARAAMSQGVLQGILWHQGESDSKPGEALLYEERLIAFIETLRNDLGTPNVPFVLGTLGDYYMEVNPEACIINASLRRIPQRVPYTACVESSGLGPTGTHFDAKDARELGRRYAQAMASM